MLLLAAWLDWTREAHWPGVSSGREGPFTWKGISSTPAMERAWQSVLSIVMEMEMARICCFEEDVSLAAVFMIWVQEEDGRSCTCKTETGIEAMHLPTIDICTDTTCSPGMHVT